MSGTASTPWLDKARENLEAARLLISQEFYAIAASRIYYAMFYVAEGLLLAVVNQTYSSHAAVIAAFGREFAKTQRLDARFHRYMIDAEELRHSSDYSVDSTITPDEVANALGWATEFIGAAEALISKLD